MLDMIGDRLRELRGEMPQEAFGAIAGTTKQYVSQLESGRNKSPNAVYIGKWASHFGVTMEWITFGGSGGARREVEPSQPQRLDAAKLTSLIETVESAVAKSRKPVPARAKARWIAALYADATGAAPDAKGAVEAALSALLSTWEEA